MPKCGTIDAIRQRRVIVSEVDGTLLKETQGGSGENGWREIGVYRAGELHAVISRPEAGMNWFVHFVGQTKPARFKRKGDAISEVLK